MSYSERSFLSLNSHGYHRIVYTDWGDPAGKPLICVHGLTGNGHDFDFIAPALAHEGFRVIAADLPGRGRSDFLPNPLDYNYRQYTQDLMALLTHLDLADSHTVDWLGVSLGGLLGIALAGIPNSPIRRLILNDVGPEVPKAALDFIHQVISNLYVFDTIKDMEDRMRATRGLTWGPVTDDQWLHMAEHNARALEDGSITYGYDPAIADIFKTEPTGPADLWPSWKKIHQPTLLIHGAKSVVLTSDIIQKMRQTKSGALLDVVQFADCGHVPSLMAPQQIEIVSRWLTTTPT
jgi:pimeloyl-ACP methyl ester carboxylesterase